MKKCFQSVVEMYIRNAFQRKEKVNVDNIFVERMQSDQESVLAFFLEHIGEEVMETWL